MGKKKTATKAVMVKCPDCSLKYAIGAPHYMFCEARHCDGCDASFSYVLSVYDSRCEPVKRLCDSCLDDGVTLDGDEYDDGE